MKYGLHFEGRCKLFGLKKRAKGLAPTVETERAPSQQGENISIHTGM